MPPSCAPSSSCRRTHALFRQRRKERAIASKPKKMAKKDDRPSSFPVSSSSSSFASATTTSAAATSTVTTTSAAATSAATTSAATTSAATTNCSSSTFASDQSLTPMSEKPRIAKQAWIKRERQRQRELLQKLEKEIRIEDNFMVWNEFLQLIGVAGPGYTEEPTTNVKVQTSLSLPGCSSSWSLLGAG